LLYAWTASVFVWASSAVFTRAPWEFLLLMSPYAAYMLFCFGAALGGGFRYIGKQEWQARPHRQSRLLRLFAFYLFFLSLVAFFSVWIDRF
jgi:hypothetical protein